MAWNQNLLYQEELADIAENYAERWKSTEVRKFISQVAVDITRPAQSNEQQIRHRSVFMSRKMGWMFSVMSEFSLDWYIC